MYLLDPKETVLDEDSSREWSETHELLKNFNDLIKYKNTAEATRYSRITAVKEDGILDLSPENALLLYASALRLLRSEDPALISLTFKNQDIHDSIWEF
jgi:hypothetical protein